MLEEYVNTGNKSLIPALHWKDLTKQEKKSWAEKVMAIDRTDELPGVPGEWVCGNFSKQVEINTRGIRFMYQNPEENFERASIKQHRRFNIPFYRVVTDSPSWTFAHELNGVLIGNNVLNFNDWYFPEPQTDEEMSPGETNSYGFVSIPNNGYLKAYYNYGYNSETGNDKDDMLFIQWDINNGDSELESHRPIYEFVTKNPKYDTIKPDFNSNIQDGEVYNEWKDFIYTISDSSPKDSCNFLDTLWHKKSDNNKYYVNLGVSRGPLDIYPPKKSHTDTLEIPETEGQHKVEVYAKDIAGNLTNKVVNWVVDVSNPSLNVNSPQEGEVYSTNPRNLFSVSDAVSGLDTTNSYIKLNGDKINWEKGYGYILNVYEGNNTLEYYFKDKAGNFISETKNFNYDTQFPQIVIEKPSGDTINSSFGTLEWDITEANPQEMWYKVNGEKTLISNKQGSAEIDFQEGKNILEVYAKDKTGKESSVTDSVYYKNTLGINKTSFTDYSVKAYPNPTQGDFKIDYEFSGPQDGKISIYNTKGQDLEKRLIQDNSEGVKHFHITKPGMYMYRVTTESGYETSGTIIVIGN